LSIINKKLNDFDKDVLYTYSKLVIMETSSLSIIKDFSISIVLLIAAMLSVSLFVSNNFLSIKIITILGLVIFGIIFLKMYYVWDKHSKDQEGKGFISLEYEIPDNLSPMEVSAIVYQEVTQKSISAELMYLANKGFISIKQLDIPIEYSPKKFSSPTMGKDYEITLLKDILLLHNKFQRKLLDRLFDYGLMEGGRVTVHISRLVHLFYLDAEKAGILAAEGLLIKGYYAYLGKMRNRTLFGIFPSITIMPLFVYVLYLIIFFAVIDKSYYFLYFCIGITITGTVFFWLSPAKTRKGALAKEALIGLKEYMKIVEKHRIEYHNAPKKRPKNYEELLPFAMVLGVEHAWAREFEHIYTAPPSKVDYVAFSQMIST